MHPTASSFKGPCGIAIYEWLGDTWSRPKGGGGLVQTQVSIGAAVSLDDLPHDVLMVQTAEDFLLVVVRGISASVKMVGGGPSKTIGTVEMCYPDSIEQLSKLLNLEEVTLRVAEDDQALGPDERPHHARRD